jgi:hypothetical protein
VTVAIEIGNIEAISGSYEATHNQLSGSYIKLYELTSPWSPVFVGRTGTTWHAWVYRTAATEIVALVENAPLWT